MPEINWNCSKEEADLINKIVDRAAATMTIKKGSLRMDITATHCNGCPLKLHDLLMADDFNFMHDILGISRHINRSNGKLENCFLPRFFRSEE